MIVSTNKGNPNTLKFIIAANIAGKEISVNEVALTHNNLGRLPVLEVTTGLELFSTFAAVEFLSQTEEEFRIITNRWLEWDITQLQPALVSYCGSGTLDTSHKPRIWSLFKELNEALKDKKYLIHEKNDASVVDLFLWVSLWVAADIPEISNLISKEFLNIENWLKNIETNKIVQQSLKQFNCDRGIKGISCIQATSWFPLNFYTGGKQSKPVNDANIKTESDVAISDDELRLIQDSWTTSSYRSVEPTYPTPVPVEKNYLITSALPYVNNVPHLGNIIGCVLSADIFARFCRQRNYNTLFICGTDEYGTATEAKALEEKLSPQQVCDKYFNIHNDIYRWFNIGFDYFGRTSTAEQTEVVQDMFLRIKSQGYIFSESVNQLLCENCDRFLADRFVEGICPDCKYEDARGDQCDGCGHLINATELIKPRCKVCSKTPIIKASTQFFLDLPKIQDKLKEWVNEAEGKWSPIARAVTKPWLRDGLKPRCITRDLKWGIPVPLEGYRDKVFYVWFDAPLGYISITKRFTKFYEKWWKPTEKVDLYQFMAKDNVPFHAIMWPATLLAADQGHTLVKHIASTEYLNYEDKKFSKSRGTGVFGTDAIETGIPADVWRFYLAYIRPESQDSNFSWTDMATKTNSELLNNLGNFVNRGLMFVEKNFEGKIPIMEPEQDDYIVLALVQRELTNYISCFSKTKIRDALKHVLAISKHGNQYLQSQEPWVKMKGSEKDRKRAGTVVGICTNLAALLSALLSPFMPSTARQLRGQLGMDEKEYGYIPELVTTILSAGHKIGKPSPLFTKIEAEQVDALRQKYSGEQVKSSPQNVKELEDKILQQANLVRDLKSKEPKAVWQPQVELLLSLKKQLAECTAVAKTSPVKKSSSPSNAKELEDKIQQQANLVRDLKSKEPKSVWQPQVELLLSLKKQLAECTAVAKTSPDKKSSSSPNAKELEDKIQQQANLVRELKSKEPKAVWQPQVELLLSLKKQLAECTGTANPSTDKKSKHKK